LQWRCPANGGVWHPLPRYVWDALEARLRVDEQVRKAVVFVGAETPGGFMTYGTGLIGLVIFKDDDGTEWANTIIVTAHHVVGDVSGETVSVRVNRKDGSADALRVQKNWGITFRDRALDLCVFPLQLDPTIYDFFAIRMSSESWRQRLAELGDPEPGDEICVVGLYTSHYGHVRNMPVARIGHIAALPEEKVATHRGHIHAYLVECQSIAGLSGSPVFWTVPRFKIENDQVLQQRAHFPLGILTGYHVVESSQDEMVVPKFQQGPESDLAELPASLAPKQEERRTGFAVVVPINHVFEIFESEEIMAILKKGANATRNRTGYRPASAGPVEVNHPASDVQSLPNAAVRKPARD